MFKGFYCYGTWAWKWMHAYNQRWFIYQEKQKKVTSLIILIKNIFRIKLHARGSNKIKTLKWQVFFF